jgi:hypothetical protein
MHKNSIWTTKIAGLPGQIENRLISADSFSRINHISQSKVVVHSNRYGVTVASLCRGDLLKRWRGPKMFYFISCLILKFVGQVYFFLKMSSKGKKGRTDPASVSVSFGRPLTKSTVEDAVKSVRILFVAAALKLPS